MTVYFNVFLKAFLTFLGLLIVTRFMGRKQLKQLTTFDHVVRITIGSISASFIINRDISVVDQIIAISTLTILSILISYIEFYSLKVHDLLEGEPVILIEKGQIVYKNMKKIKYNIEDLLMELREKDVFDINEVYYAIVESKGQFTVIKKSQFRAAQTGDFGFNLKQQEICYEIIIDGKINYKNMIKSNVTEPWLLKKLNITDKKQIKNIIIASLNSNGELYVMYK